MEIEWLVVVVLAAALAALVVAWIRAVRRSRAMVRRYRAASDVERQQLDGRMELDYDLEAYMRPLAPWEIAVAAAIVLGMLYVVAT